jgi:hypothetical protein
MCHTHFRTDRFGDGLVGISDAGNGIVYGNYTAFHLIIELTRLTRRMEFE